MKKRNFPYPLKLFAERGVFSRRSKIDLVLGDDEILIELKVEPDYPGVSKPVVFSTKAEATGSGSVEGDLEKVEEYSKKGKHMHFLMIDEDGLHTKNSREMENAPSWRKEKLLASQVHLTRTEKMK